MKKIVVITSGWVVMGDVTEYEDRLTIDDASVIGYGVPPLG